MGIVDFNELKFLEARIVNIKIDEIAFVKDYVVLKWEDISINLYIWPLLIKGENEICYGSVEYENILCSTIDKNVVSVWIGNSCLNILFDNGVKMIVKENENHTMPEILEVNSNDIWFVFTR